MIRPDTELPRPIAKVYSPYSETISHVWDTIQSIHDEPSSTGWFLPHVYDKAVTHMRTELTTAIDTAQTPHESGEALRDFHYMHFLSYGLDSIVYAPQIERLARDDSEYVLMQQTMALGIQYAATRALVSIMNDPQRDIIPEFRQYSNGATNEYVPLILLNLPKVVQRQQAIAVPGSNYEDTVKKIDIKYLQHSDTATTVVPIQLKRHLSLMDHIPTGVIAIEARDFNNERHEIARTIYNQESKPTGFDGRQTALYSAAFRLANRIDLIATPQMRTSMERARKQQRRFITPPVLTQKIGAIVPELQTYRDELAQD